MDTLALIVRGTNALARPEDHPDGPVPTVDEVAEFVTVIDFYDHAGVRVVSSSTGSAPDGWRWLPIATLQSEADVECSDLIGEAVLCGG